MAQKTDTVLLNKALVDGFDFFNKNKAVFQTYTTRELLYYASELSPGGIKINRENLLNFEPIFEDDKTNFPYYSRLSNDKLNLSQKEIKNALSKTTNLDRAMLWGLFADKLPRDKLVNHLLLAFADSAVNIRQIAHGCIVLKWATDLNAQKKINKIEYIREQYIKLLIAKIEQAKPYTDSGMEGVMGLLLLTQKEKINPEWINEIVRHQNADGGWAWHEQNMNNLSSDHPTTLALFILASMQNNNYNKINWIKK